MSKLNFIICIILSLLSNSFGEPIKNQILLNCVQVNKNIETELFKDLKNPTITKKFYEEYCKNKKTPLWIDEKLGLNSSGIELLTSLEESYLHGFQVEHYNLAEIKRKINGLQSGVLSPTEIKADTTRLDILLTNGYLSLAIDLYYGSINWDKFVKKNHDKDTTKEKRKKSKDEIDEDLISWDRGNKGYFGAIQHLKSAHKTGKIKKSLVELYPKYETYFKLLNVMKKYDEIKSQGGWGDLNITENIEINGSSDKLSLVKERLFKSGDLKTLTNLENTIYDESDLIDALKSYQSRNNLKSTGVINMETMKSLNISVEEKMAIIGVNMERYRWMDRSSTQDETKIIVNIPSLQMKLVENKDDLFSMKVIVGQAKRATPIFSEKIKYIVLNPTWTVPPSVISKDIFSQKGDQLNYFKEHDMKVFVLNRGKQIEIDPSLVEWNSFKDTDTSPFVFVANPGKKNPLGDMKFIFPNKYSVYMHDTDRKDLFTKYKRTFSSGCIRLSEPEKLLMYLLEKDKKIDKLKSFKTKNTKDLKGQVINLKSNIPVFVRYFTVSIDKENNLYFYDDVYGYDAHQRAILK